MRASVQRRATRTSTRGPGWSRREGHPFLFHSLSPSLSLTCRSFAHCALVHVLACHPIPPALYSLSACFALPFLERSLYPLEPSSDSYSCHCHTIDSTKPYSCKFSHSTASMSLTASFWTKARYSASPSESRSLDSAWTSRSRMARRTRRRWVVLAERDARLPACSSWERVVDTSGSWQMEEDGCSARASSETGGPIREGEWLPRATSNTSAGSPATAASCRP